MEPQLTPGAAITRAFASSRQQLQNALDHLNNQVVICFQKIVSLT